MRQRRPVRWLLETDGVGIPSLVRTTRASFPACGSFVMTSEDLRELPGLNRGMRVPHKRTFRIELNTGEYVAYVIFQLPEFKFYLLCLDASESASKFRCTSSFIQQGFHPRPSLYERRPKVPGWTIIYGSPAAPFGFQRVWVSGRRRVALPYRTCYSRTYSEAPGGSNRNASCSASQA